MRVCRELNDRGMTIIMITHYMEEAAAADRVVVMNEGRIACEGTPEEVLTQPTSWRHSTWMCRIPVSWAWRSKRRACTLCRT